LRKDVGNLIKSFVSQDQMLHEFLTRLLVISTILPPKSRVHTMSQPTDSSSIGPHKPARIQFSKFLGTNTDRWVLQAECYFTFYNIQEQDRLTIASFYLDNDATEWFD
ncbi:hypothetical protein J1N35_041680, partial [Gossypium stocksii]